MRIARIDLKAYGHFTNYALELPGDPDFHIIYGPNEAGKTTISRALEAALFGFQRTTVDDFIHSYGDLRVGLVLESGKEALAVMRRKGIKNTLISYDVATGEETGQAVSDDALPRIMGGLSIGLFTSMFGIGHDELVAGGRALSEGEGEIGQSLFEAGAGLTSIRALREALTKEADDLFRPKASTSAIFKSLHGYKEAKDSAKAAQTRPAAWDTLRKASEVADENYTKTKKEQERLQRELRRLERLAAVLPDVASRAQILEHLDAMGDVRCLEADARQKRIQAETLLSHGQDGVKKAEADIVRLQSDLNVVPSDSDILAEASAVEAVYHQRTAYREARDAVVAATSHIVLVSRQETDIAQAIGETLRDDLRMIIPTATQRARVQDLSSEGRTIKTGLAQAQETEEEANSELQQIGNELAGLGTQHIPASLNAAIRTFDTDGNVEKSASDLARQAQNDRSNLERAAKALTEMALDAFVAATLPLPSELQSFKDARDKQTSDKTLFLNNIVRLEDDLGNVTGEIEGLEQGGEVPTAEHLAERRQAREGMWQKIRNKIFHDGKTIDEPVPSASEYEMAVQAADGTADARFADVSRVSRHAELLTRLAQMRNALELERNRLAENENVTAEFDERWQGLLTTHCLPSMDLTKLTEWIAKRGSIVERHLTCVDLAAQASEAAEMAKTMRDSLSAALVEAGMPACDEIESFAQAIARAREHVKQAGESALEAKVLKRQQVQAKARLDTAARKISEYRKATVDWKITWGTAMADIRLKNDALEMEAAARLQQFEMLSSALDALDAARADLDTARETQSRIEDEVTHLCATTAHDSGQRPVDAVIEALYDRLGKARSQAEKAHDITNRIDSATETKEAAERSVALANKTLTGLMAAAECDTLEDLANAEQRSADWLRLNAELNTVEERVVKASAMSLKELLEQAAAQVLAQVQADIDRTTLDLAAATTRVEEEHTKLIEARNALAEIDGTAKAGAAEQDAASAAARMAQHISDYTAVTVASAILSDVIDTYQQRHQGPLLARASDIFASITGGRYAKVVTDFKEDKTVLVTLTRDGKRKGIDALSSGRRDQLFLALRLAAIESHVVSQEPVPVVVDDIVINFDDDAASATFTVLAELAKRTQVLFFTHHEHLLGRAERALGTGKFRAHLLKAV